MLFSEVFKDSVQKFYTLEEVMGFSKMTDILASSNKFVALVTYISEHKTTESHPSEWMDFIEVYPVIHAGKNDDYAPLFFDVITSDSSDAYKHKKQENLDTLINLCSKNLKAQILDNLQKRPLEILRSQNKKIHCFLLDKNGKVSKQAFTTPRDMLHALDVLEEQIFISNADKNEKKEQHVKPKKSTERRQAHKYYFQHVVH